jgi:hypothetical protein
MHPMAGELSIPRFLIRQGAIRGGAKGCFMVWDRQTKGPAELGGRLTVGLSEEDAREIKEWLTVAVKPVN